MIEMLKELLVDVDDRYKEFVKLWEKNADWFAQGAMSAYKHVSDELRKIIASGGWISADDLPKRSGDVIISNVNSKRVKEAYFDAEEKKFVHHNGLTLNVTHWQPLPEPPEEGVTVE